MLLGGSDTVSSITYGQLPPPYSIPTQTESTITGFILLMALFPKAAQVAQAEIDRVVGKGRLPLFSDRDQLPYTNALVKEVFRWHSVVPTSKRILSIFFYNILTDRNKGIPHRGMQDDEYNGFFIPKGKN